MPLIEEQQRKVQDLLDYKMAKGTCPICGNAYWAPNPGLAAPAILNADGTDAPLGGEPVAQVVFFYRNSGSLRLFSAMVMGLTSADERSHGEHRWVTCSPTPCPR